MITGEKIKQLMSAVAAEKINLFSGDAAIIEYHNKKIYMDGVRFPCRSHLVEFLWIINGKELHIVSDGDKETDAICQCLMKFFNLAFMAYNSTNPISKLQAELVSHVVKQLGLTPERLRRVINSV